METRSDYGAKQQQKRKKFESDVRFEMTFEMNAKDLEYYTVFAKQLGYATLKEFLEDECQRALFALENDPKLIGRQMKNISSSKHALIV